MMLELLETGKALYVLTAVCVLGLLSRLTARNLYRRLIRETDNMTLTKNHYLQDLKQRTENTYRFNQGIQNTKVYLEKQLAGYRFLRLTLQGWTNLSGQLTILCFLAGGAAAFMSYWYRCDNYYIVMYGTTGILTGLLTLFVDCGINLPERRNQLLNALQDYMENSLFHRLALETASAMEGSPRDRVRDSGRGIREVNIREANIRDLNSQDISRRKKQEKNETQRKDADYMKHSLEQIAASREKSRGDSEWIKELSPEELELVGEILKQYLV